MMSIGLPDIRFFWSRDERVLSQLKLGQKYQEVSKYPSVVRDISFVVSKDMAVNDYYDLVRDIAGDLIEEFEQIDAYENKDKFGPGKISYTYRIIYRSLERTLTNQEVNDLHEEICAKTKSELGAVLR